MQISNLGDGLRNATVHNKFNQCTTINYTDSLSSSDVLNSKDMNWFNYIWVLPSLMIILMVLQQLDSNGQIGFISRYLGPPVTLAEFTKGTQVTKENAADISIINSQTTEVEIASSQYQDQLEQSTPNQTLVALKSMMLPVFKPFNLVFEPISALLKPCFKLLDFSLYVADMVSDIKFSIFLWHNCHFYYFKFSVGSIVLSYITTVLYLRLVVHYKEGWLGAIFYPLKITKVVFVKALSTISCKRLKFL